MRAPRSVVPTSVRACLFFAVMVAALFLIAGIGRTGIWDPHELDRAELARRIAIHLFDQDRFAAGGDAMPTLSDLGSGELGFTSMAAGFATLGLHEVGGRLPLALWCLGGLLVTFAFVARMASPRAGLFAAVVLATMPAYFAQARTMLGDGVTMAAFAMCFFGLAGAVAEPKNRPAAAFFVVGVFGGVCGFLSRGAIVGVAAPALGVGLGWIALLGAGHRAWRTPRRTLVGTFALVCGAAAAWRGALPLVELGHDLREVKRVLGVAVLHGPPRESTFDLTVRELGHGLFPWSALLPFACGLLLVPAHAREGEGTPLHATRSFLVAGAAAAYGAHAALAPFTGALAFAGVAVLAAIIGVVIDELDRGPAVPVVAAGVLFVLAVLSRDMLELPDKGLVAFAVPDAELPAAVAESLRPYLMAASAVFALFAALSLSSPLPGGTGTLGERVRARVASYQRLIAELSRIWAGNLAFGFLVVEAALLGVGATLLIGRRLGWPSVVGMSRSWAYVGLNLWWFVPLALVTLPLSVDVARRGFSWLAEKARAPRSAGMLIAALGSGALTCFGYYGEMAEQLSPKGALDAYAALHAEGEPLGLYGVNPRMGRYYGGGDTTALLSSAREAARWLAADPEGPTRWLAFRDARLAELNALCRSERGENLAMTDTGSGSILLAKSRAGEPNDNPLAPFVRSDPPPPLSHPLDARFGDQLDVLGWEVVDDEGRPVEEIVVGRDYRMRLHLAVVARVPKSYRAFIHIDAEGRRHNGDHEVLGGLYPMTYWREGDYIVDEHELALERHFLPGRYAVYFGYYLHKERLPVTKGRHHEDRLYGGVLVVR